jgi:hypothetical protein
MFGGPIGLEIVNTHRFRLMARLLLLRENNQISDNDWEEFKASKTSRKEDTKTKKFEVAARFTKWLCQSNISEHEIVDLLYSVISPLLPASARSDKTQMQNKFLVIKLPILRGFYKYDPAIPSLLLAGPLTTCTSPYSSSRHRRLSSSNAQDSLFDRTLQHPFPFTNRTTRYLAHPLLDTDIARRWPA